MYIILTDFILRTPHLFSFIWVSHKNLFKCTVYFTSVVCMHHLHVLCIQMGKAHILCSFRLAYMYMNLSANLQAMKIIRFQRAMKRIMCYWYSHPQCYTNMTQSQGQCIIYVEYKDDISSLSLQKQVKIEGYTC